MQTSDSSSFHRPATNRITRAAGVGAGIGFALLMTSSWLACSPGVLDCGKVTCPGAKTGGNGGGGEGGEGGGGGGGAGGAGGMAPEVPDACKGLEINSLSDVETKFIMPKCGASACHQAVFPPRNLNMQAKIRENMIGKKGTGFCKTDDYINKADPKGKSYVLAKVTATAETAECPSGGDGGTRMPNLVGGVAGKVDKRLSEEEIECFTWWVESVAGM
jgi:hypothetical protein